MYFLEILFDLDKDIVDLTGEPLGCCVSHRTCTRKELVPMVTYADLFQFVIMLCAVVTLVVILVRKK